MEVKPLCMQSETGGAHIFISQERIHFKRVRHASSVIIRNQAQYGGLVILGSYGKLLELKCGLLHRVLILHRLDSRHSHYQGLSRCSDVENITDMYSERVMGIICSLIAIVYSMSFTEGAATTKSVLRQSDMREGHSASMAVSVTSSVLNYSISLLILLIDFEKSCGKMAIFSIVYLASGLIMGTVVSQGIIFEIHMPASEKCIDECHAVFIDIKAILAQLRQNHINACISGICLASIGTRHPSSPDDRLSASSLRYI